MFQSSIFCVSPVNSSALRQVDVLRRPISDVPEGFEAALTLDAAPDVTW
ncbi:hypothetical protein FNYG_12646 [Fusarium nygamai]|uniref:Uncharacterized protein n=1 Tax=Gibberella nygamai TaxID=42673 RepID=A0A2K0VVG8_GIBNY|nr:hypothetical protein FNYG_12646 [Fusarium nygamai]